MADEPESRHAAPDAAGAEKDDQPLAPAAASSPPAPARPRWRRWVPGWRALRRGGTWVAIAVVALAAGSLVSVVTIDLGPSLRAQAEQQFARFIDRPVSIDRLSTRLLPGRFVVEGLLIGGLNPGDRPFFRAEHVELSTEWLPLLRGEVLVDAVDLRGWRMLVEGFEDGRHTFPRFVERQEATADAGAPAGESGAGGTATDVGEQGRRIVTTVQYLRAHDGEFVYEDHGAPWSITAPNIDLSITKTTGYGGRATFHGGTLLIGDFEPMEIGMDADYVLDGGLVHLTRVDLRGDGFDALVDGRVDMLNWPESLYHIRESAIDLPVMKDIFFAGDDFTVTGAAAFTGQWHLFDGGRELTGRFTSASPVLSGLDYPALAGDLIWTRDRFEITRAHSSFYGGDLDFTFAMKPLGAPEPGFATFVPRVASADLERLFVALGVRGVRPQGQLAGEARLEWPLGRFTDRRGEGAVSISPPEGIGLLPRGVRPRGALSGWTYAAQPFEPGGAPWRFPLGGEMRFTLESDRVEIAPSWAATPLTAMTFEGRSDGKGSSRIPFEVFSADWQESDRVMASVMTAFGRPTGDLELAGYGSMIGVMLGDLSSPRVEARFDGDGIRAWNVDWGHGEGDIVVEDGVLDVTDAEFRDATSALAVDGHFAIGPPRPGRDDIDARFDLEGLPAHRVRDAFELEGYPIDGPAFGQIRLFGAYRAPFGFGRIRLGAGEAYGEEFDRAEADLRFDGVGVWLGGLTVTQGDGEVTGVMHVEWDGTYSVNADARGLDVSRARLLGNLGAPVSGRLDAAIGGSGTFDAPRYTIRGTVTDLAIEGADAGQLTGRIDVDDTVLAVELEAASPNVAVSGSGRIDLGDEARSDLRFNVTNTRLDPFIRTVQPELPDDASLVASGTAWVGGPLGDVERMEVEVTVDQLTLALFDYLVSNDGPVRLSLQDSVVKVDQMRLRGEGTAMEIGGDLSLADERVALRVDGDANLGILQGLVADVRSRGTMRLAAEIGGSFSDPVLVGEATILDGRLRHLSLPHALGAVNGRVSLEPGGVSFDQLTAELGGGAVRFGGRVGLAGYRIADINVTASGRNIALRYPEGIRSRVDAELTLRGSVDSATLGGLVTVQDAIWMELFESDGGLFDLSGAGATSLAGAPEATLPLQFDLRIEAPSSLRISDNRAQVVASADLTLTGSYDRPALLGNAQIERGQIYFEGNRYRMTRGNIAFTNPLEIEPTFDVEAETDIRVPGQTYRVTLGLNGTLDRLEQPTLESDPPLQQFEIIGLLLGDVRDPQQAEIRSLRSPEASQQERLLQAAGAGLLNNPLGGVMERSLGVDNFEITPSLDDPTARQSAQLVPTARVRIGKRISDRAYLTFSRAVSGSNQDLIVMLEYDASDGLSWVLSQNEDRTYAVDVRFRHAF